MKTILKSDKSLIFGDFYKKHRVLASARFLFIGIMVRVFANSTENRGSIPGRSHTKDSKMLLYASLLNTQHYKVRIKNKVEESKEKN